MYKNFTFCVSALTVKKGGGHRKGLKTDQKQTGGKRQMTRMPGSPATDRHQPNQPNHRPPTQRYQPHRRGETRQEQQPKSPHSKQIVQSSKGCLNVRVGGAYAKGLIIKEKVE